MIDFAQGDICRYYGGVSHSNALAGVCGRNSAHPVPTPQTGTVGTKSTRDSEFRSRAVPPPRIETEGGK